MVVPVVALVPARGGSLTIPQKNLATVGAFNLLERAIRCAIGSVHVSACVVSSDDAQVLLKARSYGAQGHLRSSNASTQEATAADVLVDLLPSLQARYPDQDPIIIYLQPTSPFRRSSDVDDAIALMGKDLSRFVVSIDESTLYVEKCVTVIGDVLYSYIDEGSATSNRQGLSPCWMPNGAVYSFRLSHFLARGSIPIDGAVPLRMNRIASLDVDDMEDLLLAQQIAEVEDVIFRH